MKSIDPNITNMKKPIYETRYSLFKSSWRKFAYFVRFIFIIDDKEKPDKERKKVEEKLGLTHEVTRKKEEAMKRIEKEKKIKKGENRV